MTTVKEIGKRAKMAARTLAVASTEVKNRALCLLVEELVAREEAIAAANRRDCERAKEAGLQAAMVDRLSLSGRFSSLVEELRQIIALPDPVGQLFDQKKLPNGLTIAKRRTPIGVLAVIYEARPNVTVDVAALGLKSGNAVILRGGKESFETNQLLVEAIREALKKADLPEDCAIALTDPDRARVKELLRLDRYVDMVIPRGGERLQRLCIEESTIPVITGGIGICHLFIDRSANLAKALPLILNAKAQRPTVCNALDTLLLHRDVAKEALLKLLGPLKQAGVTPHLDAESWELLPPEFKEGCKQAEKNDFDREWLSLDLSVATVEGIGQALAHIADHGSGHSDAILTEDAESKERFIAGVDSAAVYVNASTRFTDGAQFGLGAEVAVSTQKLHARGPLGLEALTTYKWVAEGDYTARE